MMNYILEFFENFDMPAAAAELSSGKVVYMNKKAHKDMKGEYNISLTEGEKALLRHGEFMRRTVNGNLPDTAAEVQTTLIESDGKTLVFEIMTALIQHSDAADAKLCQNWASCAFCCAMQAENPNDPPIIMLEKACVSLNAKRAFIYEKDSENDYRLSHRYASEGAAYGCEMTSERCEQIYDILSKEKRLVITSDDFGEPLSEILTERDIQSFAAVPIYDGGEMIGFCCAENFPVCKQKKGSEALEVFFGSGIFIGSCLKWGRLFEKLKKMGLTDDLTGIGNRHAMNLLCARLKEPVPLGLIFCDISGLKHINDTFGHCAGDEYIQNACAVLKKLFPIETLFRIGGDELLAILTDTSQAAVDEKTALLKSELENSSIAMAVGSAFGISDGNGMSKLLFEAETKMYKDKTDYYRRSGRERRRC
ncbi:MAG: diguanylate cyclase domain-containing protein [Oscillospiraceae bacterium]